MGQSILTDKIPRFTIDANSVASGNEYRIVDASVEFRIGTGTWRILTDDEIRWHFRLHTEVAAWLEGEFKNSWVWN